MSTDMLLLVKSASIAINKYIFISSMLPQKSIWGYRKVSTDVLLACYMHAAPYFYLFRKFFEGGYPLILQWMQWKRTFRFKFCLD